MAHENRMSTGCRSMSNSNSTDNNTSASCAARPDRRHRGSSFRAAAMAGVLVAGVIQQIIGYADATGFEYGDPIDVVVTSGDQLTLTFEGYYADAVAISFQQCSGSSYLRANVLYNQTSMTGDSTLDSSQCTRLLGSGASTDSVAVEYDNLCAFKNSGPVALGYTEETETVGGGNITSYSSSSADVYSLSIDPRLVSVELTNRGDTTASAQIVMFSTTFPAPSADASIDRVHTHAEQDENTYTIEAEFQAEGSEDQNFCASDDGCAVYAYYLEVNENDEDADKVFGTSCQASTGTLAFEGTTGAGTSGGDDDGDSEADDDYREVATNTVTASETSFDLTACVEFPKNTEGEYRVYLVVSPDTTSYAGVGYGLQDQLIYSSGIIYVDSDMDTQCPELVEVEETDAAYRMAVATPMKVSGAMALGLAAAAARAGL